MARAAAVGLVAPFLTFASALAPAHVHEPGPGQEHGLGVAHSHFAPHELSSHDHDVEGPEIEHGDEHVVWLDSPILHQSPYQVAPVPAVVCPIFETVHIERHWSVTPFDDAAPVHGPPKTAALFRGPPTFLV
jgi:hypothetical protein